MQREKNISQGCQRSLPNLSFESSTSNQVRASVKIWDTRTGKNLTTYADRFFNGVNDAFVAAWLPDGKTIAMLFDGNVILIW